ncbi:HNH endonuclease [soil metagenome]
MRRIARLVLEPASVATLASLQKDVDSAGDAPARAGILWKRQRSGKRRAAAFGDVRVKLQTMAPGRARCMYCEDSLGTDIDHFRPKSVYSGLAFAWSNYLLACSHCNSNEKRAEFPLDPSGSALLIDPASEDPVVHLVLVPETGRLEPVSPRGSESERVFGLNRRDELTAGRTDTWTQLERLVRDVGAAHARGDRPSVLRLIGEAKRLSFQSVVHHFVRDALNTPPAFVRRTLARTILATAAEWAWAR